MPCHNQIRDFIREDKRLIMNNLHPRCHFVELIALHTEDIETRRSNSYCVGRGSQQRGEVPDHQKRATIWGYRAAQAPRQKEICMGYYTGNNRRRGGTIESSAHAVNLVTAEPRRNFQVKARLPRLHPHFEHYSTSRQKEPPSSAFHPYIYRWLRSLFILLLDFIFRVYIRLWHCSWWKLVYGPPGFQSSPWRDRRW